MQDALSTFDTEVEQADVDGLVRDLQAMRAVLARDQSALRPQLEAMIFRARNMRDRAAGSRFEKSLTAAYDMLLKLQHAQPDPLSAPPPAPRVFTSSPPSLWPRWPFRRSVAA